MERGIQCDECGKNMLRIDAFIVFSPPDEAERIEECFCSQSCLAKRFR